ncbi:MAG TPA: type II toxin-antitoxin system RelE/ParE family toxin [Chloroflexota bacterium]|nr:type II toxin-antitoxin system RelE/ParE family toxin [Chloroflexota bacterium]
MWNGDRNFGDEATRDIFLAKATRQSRSIPLDLHRTVRRKLQSLAAATTVQDLRVPPGNRLEKLEGMAGLWSIRVNDQYRITFRLKEETPGR